MADAALYLGLISGTSADGIDAALIEFDVASAPLPRLIAGRTYPYPDDLRASVLALSQSSGAVTLDDLGALDARLGEAFAQAALQLLEEFGVATSAVRAIGSHGQTLRHRPDAPVPFTLQCADGNRIAERTGIRTVSDFRRRDVAAGGHGAPLTPAYHQAVLSSAQEARAVLNLGGIGNLTLLPPDGPVIGFDTGPGNSLMDAWTVLHRNQSYDAGGAFAAEGQLDPALLGKLLAEPWFALPAPKSTGREQFNLDWLQPYLVGAERQPESVQATLCALTAATVSGALLRQQPDCGRLLVCGGGVHNPVLMAALGERLPGIRVQSTADLGLDPDFIEAMAFAWLAARTLAGLSGNLPSVTGALGPRVLGAIHPA